jgi:hypothetical protein
MRVSHPEEWPLGRVSKDEKYIGSWFETRQRVRAKRRPMINSDALLTMRIALSRRAGLRLQIGALVDPRHP